VSATVAGYHALKWGWFTGVNLQSSESFPEGGLTRHPIMTGFDSLNGAHHWALPALSHLREACEGWSISALMGRPFVEEHAKKASSRQLQVLKVIKVRDGPGKNRGKHDSGT